MSSVPEATGAVSTEVEVTVRVNGSWRPLRLDSRVRLLDALRDRLELTRTATVSK